MQAAGWTTAAQEDLLRSLAGDYSTAELDPSDRAMLDYAVKLTRTPWGIGEADVEGLRQVAFDDRAIHDICSIVAYFAFVNRVADGLGVELEGEGNSRASRPGSP